MGNVLWVGHRSRREPVNELAAAILLRLAAAREGSLQHPLYMLQIGQPSLQVSQTFFDAGLDVLTGARRGVAELDQHGNILERKTRGLRRSDEAQPLQCLLTEPPIIPGRPALRLEQANAFVVADG